jgi:hypothetical protein
MAVIDENPSYVHRNVTEVPTENKSTDNSYHPQRLHSKRLIKRYGDHIDERMTMITPNA